MDTGQRGRKSNEPLEKLGSFQYPKYSPLLYTSQILDFLQAT